MSAAPAFRRSLDDHLRVPFEASLTAKTDQIKLYGIVGDATAALESLAKNIWYRERARPGSAPSPIQIAKARVIARNLSRALDAFKEQR